MKDRCESQPIVRAAVTLCGAVRPSVVDEKPVPVCRPLQFLSLLCRLKGSIHYTARTVESVSS